MGGACYFLFILGWVRGINKAFVGQKELAYQLAVNDLKTSVSEGKALVAAAVTGKGVATAADDTFQQMADNIDQISTSPTMYVTTFVTVTTYAEVKEGSVSVTKNTGNFIVLLGDWTDVSDPPNVDLDTGRSMAMGIGIHIDACPQTVIVATGGYGSRISVRDWPDATYSDIRMGDDNTRFYYKCTTQSSFSGRYLQPNTRYSLLYW